MRKYVLAATILAVTAVTGYTAGAALVGDPTQNTQVRSGIAGADHGGNVILAKGDKSGTGPGSGGHKGAHKGEGKGKQHGEEKGKGKK
jgi:hypothetical protein